MPPGNFKTTGERNWTKSVFLRRYASLFCTMLVSSIQTMDQHEKNTKDSAEAMQP